MEDSHTRNSLPTEPDELLDRARAGDCEAINLLLERNRPRLTRMVRCRLDPRLHGRIDDSDVIQEAFLEVSRRLDEYFRDPRAPFFLWLRTHVGYKLQEVHRRHLGVKARSVKREISVYSAPVPEATTTMLAERLLGRISSPSIQATRAEMKIRLQEVLNQLPPLDREAIALRHFEQLNNREAAMAMNVSEAAASSRYLRAIKTLRNQLKDFADFFQ